MKEKTPPMIKRINLTIVALIVFAACQIGYLLATKIPAVVANMPK